MVPNSDHARAAASLAGRIGEDPSGLTLVYAPLLKRMESVLLRCPTEAPCADHSALLLLLDLPASLDAGEGDHRIDLKGPLTIAATIAEDSLLEYTNGVPADQVGWGGLDPQTLRQWMERHTAASDLTRRTYYVASSQA